METSFRTKFNCWKCWLLMACAANSLGISLDQKKNATPKVMATLEGLVHLR